MLDVDRRPHLDAAVERLYVLGLGKLARRGQSVNEAAALFKQAIHQDSLFAPAYSSA